MIRPPLPLLERLPYKPPKPDNLPKLREARSMTTAAGFVCSEGVVLCAETQMTQGWSKFSQSKFRTFYSLAAQPAFVFASNNVQFTEMAIQRLVGCISSAPLGTRSMIRLLEGEVRAINKEFPKESAQHEVLLVLRIKGPRTPASLFHISGRVLSPVLQYFCLGDAQVVAQGLTAELYHRHADMERTAFVAAFVLAESKKYGGSSGGVTQILLAWNDRPYEMFPNERQGELFASARNIDEAYFDLKLMFQNVLRDYCDGKLSQPKFMERLKTFTVDIAERRLVLILKASDRYPKADEPEGPT